MSSPGAPQWQDTPNGHDHRIGIVAATWHDEIVHELIKGCVAKLLELGVHEKNLHIVRCPGTFEIPVIASTMATNGDYNAVIALGVVIRGETAHFEFIAGSAAQALQTVAIDNSLPCVYGILTVDTLEQAWERTGGVHGHKGAEAADVAVRMASIISKVMDPSD